MELSLNQIGFRSKRSIALQTVALEIADDKSSGVQGIAELAGQWPNARVQLLNDELPHDGGLLKAA